MSNKKVKGYCRYCGFFQNDLFKHLGKNPKHKSPNPKDKSNYKAYHRGRKYREAQMKNAKYKYRFKHPKKRKLKEFF